MAHCAYCDDEGDLTTEPLVPVWYVPGGDGAVLRSDKHVSDVCASCRSLLGEPAEHARQLFTGDLPRVVLRDTVTHFDYDYALLFRWLLSTSYDAARVHGEDVRILRQYRDVATGRMPIPPDLQLWLRTVAPTTPAGTVFAPATSANRVVAMPRWFRIGRMSADDFGCEAWSFRQVAVDSYCFMLLLPDAGKPDEARIQRVYYSEVIDPALGDPIWLDPRRTPWVPGPADDALSFTLANAGIFPLGCEQVDDLRLAEALRSESGVVELHITREEVEAGDIAPVLVFLAHLVATRDTCLRMQQQLSISLTGYEGDARSLLDDHHALAWLLALDREWPYWMYFQAPDGRWLKLASVWMGNPTRMEDGKTVLDPEVFGQTVRNWFLALNRLCHVLGHDTTTCQALSHQAYEVLAQE